MKPSDCSAYAGPVLDALPQHIAVIDRTGLIRWTNRAWRAFGEANGAPPGDTGEGANYFDACAGAIEAGEPEAGQALAMLRAVIEGAEPAGCLEYSCHSRHERRWFLLRCTPISPDGDLFAVTHENITERKLAELHVQQLAMTDGLTGIANRRRFDEVLESEGRRAPRAGGYLSLILIDIDDFKGFNDAHGHMAGDECLRRIAQALAPLGRRPGDLVARYGGEEFAIVLGGTDAPGAEAIAEAARQAVMALEIAHPEAPDGFITISAGVATLRASPGVSANTRDLQRAADDCLYEAKRAGRNVVRTAPIRIGRAAG